MANQIRNLASAIVRTGPGRTGTTMVVEDGYGSGMPDAPFFLTATPPGQLSTRGNSEIVLVTALNNDTMTIVRAQKETSAKDISAGWSVSNSVYVELSAHVGDVVMTLNATPGPGRLFMDGSTHNKADFPLLYDHVSRNSAYGVVTTTTFTLADMRTRMPVGVGDSYILGSTGGEEKHTLTGDELPNSKFYLNFHGNGDSTVLAAVSSSGAITNTPKRHNRYRSGGSSSDGAQSIGDVSFEFGANQAHNNMPPYIAVNFEVVAG